MIELVNPMNEKHRRIFTNFTHWFADGTGFSIPGWVMFRDYIQKLKNLTSQERKFRRQGRQRARSMGRKAGLAELQAWYQQTVQA